MGRIIRCRCRCETTLQVGKEQIPLIYVRNSSIAWVLESHLIESVMSQLNISIFYTKLCVFLLLNFFHKRFMMLDVYKSFGCMWVQLLLGYDNNTYPPDTLIRPLFISLQLISVRIKLGLMEILGYAHILYFRKSPPVHPPWNRQPLFPRLVANRNQKKEPQTLFKIN